jgi:hypothetical protein
MTIRPDYIYDAHNRLVDQLFIILDRAAVEYDEDKDVVEDFTQYIRDWATRRNEAILDSPNGI